MSDVWRLSEHHLALIQTVKSQQGQLGPEFQRQISAYVFEAGVKNTIEATMSDDLIKWFKEADGFSQGTKAPHKWVLQAEQEIRMLRRMVAATDARAERAEAALATARRDALEEALDAVWETDSVELAKYGIHKIMDRIRALSGKGKT
jgi:hypothetical protein